MSAAPQPTARVGFVGAGQLARMSQQAAIALGVQLHVLTERREDPAVLAGCRPVVADDRTLEGLRALAAQADVVTFEHELAPPELLAELGREATVRPSPAVELLAQDKLHQRRTLAAAGLPVPAFVALDAEPDAALATVEAFAAEQGGWPVVAKATRGGYDGRGVWVLEDADQARELLADCAGREVPLLAERHVPFTHELAVLVARRPAGEVAVFPVVQTRQQDGICVEAVAPAPVPAAVREQAAALGRQLAEQVGLEGLMAIELFALVVAGAEPAPVGSAAVDEAGAGEGGPRRRGWGPDAADPTPGLPQGPGAELLVNELALRPHNSGHLTIEGCVTSQFEQHLRAVLDWPLGETALRCGGAAMVNVLGPADGSDPADRLAAALAHPGAHVHLYAKATRPGRKLGHVTAVADDADTALARARAAAQALTR